MDTRRTGATPVTPATPSSGPAQDGRGQDRPRPTRVRARYGLS